MTYGDTANHLPWIYRILALWRPWHIAARCTMCGAGSDYAKPGEGAPTTGNKRWLCSTCGASAEASVKWIGRTNQYNTWEWLPEDRLPADLQPAEARTRFERAVEAAVAAALPAKLDEEFEARVRAGVEAELAARGYRGGKES